MNARTVSILATLVALIIVIAVTAVGYFISNWNTLVSADGVVGIVVGFTAIVGCAVFLIGAISYGMFAELRTMRKRHMA